MEKLINLFIRTYNFRNISIIAALFAVCLSLCFSFLIFPSIHQSLNLVIDPDKYGDLAGNIFNGNGYKYSGTDKPTIDRGPIYPYLISFLYRIIGKSDYRIVQIFQALLFGITGIILYQTVNILAGKRRALISQIIFCLHPMFIWYTSRIWIETTHTFLIMLTAWTLIKINQKMDLRFVFLLGITLGVTILTKSVMVLFPLLLMPLFYLRWGKASVTKYSLLTIIVSYLIVAPWTIRNYVVTKRFVPVHSSLGTNFILGDALAENWLNSPLSNMSSWSLGNSKALEVLKNSNTTPQDADGDKKLITYVIEHNSSRPTFLLWRTLVNSITFWYLSESAHKSILLVCLQFPLLILFLLNLKGVWKEKSSLILITGLILYYFAVHSVIIGWARYSVPIIPLLLIVVIVSPRNKT
jgi:4-amino-4-deoxy-L-arabinose transferase-like glycosyltransferase